MVFGMTDEPTKKKRKRSVQRNPTASRYFLKMQKLMKKAGKRLNLVESNFTKAWLTYSNYSLLQQRNIDKWLCKYEVSGADPHGFRPFTMEKQSAGGFKLCYLTKKDVRSDILVDLTRKDAEILYAYLNDYPDELRKALNRKG